MIVPAGQSHKCPCPRWTELSSTERVENLPGNFAGRPAETSSARCRTRVQSWNAKRRDRVWHHVGAYRVDAVA
jgi:hypothetical protein